LALRSNCFLRFIKVHFCAFYPFSAATLALPLPWFRVLPHPLPYIDMDALRIMGVEFVFYGAVLAAVYVARYVLARVNTHGARFRCTG
jgi:hypothetical protein